MKFQTFNNLIYANNDDNSKILFQNIPCNVLEKPYRSSKKWYMKVKITDTEILDKINIIDDFFEKSQNKKVQNTIRDNIIVLKLPFRYNKFECTVYDKHGDYYSCYELENGDKVHIDIIHACFSFQETHYLSTWKVIQIKLKD